LVSVDGANLQTSFLPCDHRLVLFQQMDLGV
jgi:hypothetical protein